MSTVDHLPLPNLASYSALSALSFAVSLGYALSSEKGFYGALQGEVWCTWVSDKTTFSTGYSVEGF